MYEGKDVVSDLPSSELRLPADLQGSNKYQTNSSLTIENTTLGFGSAGVSGLLSSLHARVPLWWLFQVKRLNGASEALQQNLSRCLKQLSAVQRKQV